MKRWYRVLALLLLFVLLPASGCVMRTGPMPDELGERISDPVTAEALLRVMSRRLRRLPSAELAAQAALDAVEDTGRGMADAAMEVSLRGELLPGELRLHLSGELNMNVMDMSMDFPLELFIFPGPDTLNAQILVMDQWVTGSIPLGAGETEGAPSGLPGFSLSGDALRSAVVREDKETVGDRECWRLDLTLRAGELGLPAGLPAEPVPGWEELTCTLTCWVDVRTILPARLILSAEGPIGNEEYTLRRAEVQIDFTGFGAVEDVQLPGETPMGEEADDGTGFSL